MSLIGDHVRLQLAPVPSTGDGRLAAGTVQGPFFGADRSNGNQAGTISVWAEPHQISSEALWTLNAMAKTRHHGRFRSNRPLNQYLTFREFLFAGKAGQIYPPIAGF